MLPWWWGDELNQSQADADQNTSLRKETLQLNSVKKKIIKIQLSTGNGSWHRPVAKRQRGCLENQGGRQSFPGCGRVAGAGSALALLCCILGGAGIFHWGSGCTQRDGRCSWGMPICLLPGWAGALPGCPPPGNLPTGSPYKVKVGWLGSLWGHRLARIVVQREKSRRLAGFLSCPQQESMEKQLQEGEVAAMKAYWCQISVKTKGKSGCMTLRLGDSSFPLKKTQSQTSHSTFPVRTRFSTLGRQLSIKINIHICDSVLHSPYTSNSLIFGGSTEHSQNTRLRSSSAFYETVLPVASISFPSAYMLRMNWV